MSLCMHPTSALVHYDHFICIKNLCIFACMCAVHACACVSFWTETWNFCYGTGASFKIQRYDSCWVNTVASFILLVFLSTNCFVCGGGVVLLWYISITSFASKLFVCGTHNFTLLHILICFDTFTSFHVNKTCVF